jgi:hypothetical protein
VRGLSYEVIVDWMIDSSSGFDSSGTTPFSTFSAIIKLSAGTGLNVA